MLRQGPGHRAAKRTPWSRPQVHLSRLAPSQADRASQVSRSARRTPSRTRAGSVQGCPATPPARVAASISWSRRSRGSRGSDRSSFVNAAPNPSSASAGSNRDTNTRYAAAPRLPGAALPVPLRQPTRHLARLATEGPLPRRCRRSPGRRGRARVHPGSRRRAGCRAASADRWGRHRRPPGAGRGSARCAAPGSTRSRCRRASGAARRRRSARDGPGRAPSLEARRGAASHPSRSWDCPPARAVRPVGTARPGTAPAHFTPPWPWRSTQVRAMTGSRWWASAASSCSRSRAVIVRSIPVIPPAGTPPVPAHGEGSIGADHRVDQGAARGDPHLQDFALAPSDAQGLLTPLETAPTPGHPVAAGVGPVERDLDEIGHDRRSLDRGPSEVGAETRPEHGESPASRLRRRPALHRAGARRRARPGSAEGHGYRRPGAAAPNARSGRRPRRRCCRSRDRAPRRPVGPRAHLRRARARWRPPRPPGCRRDFPRPPGRTGAPRRRPRAAPPARASASPAGRLPGSRRAASRRPGSPPASTARGPRGRRADRGALRRRRRGCGPCGR